MKFRFSKLGMVFKVEEQKHLLPQDFGSHAQSPQAIEVDSGIRIYFSYRTKPDSRGYVSTRVSYCDFTRDFSDITQVCSREVIARSDLGSFDQHGIFPFNPVKVGASILGFTTGWSRRTAVNVETAIGLVISNDGGESFSRFGTGPVLSALQADPFLVCDGFVRICDGDWHMWYLYGERWVKSAVSGAFERVYKIGHATSSNGIDWHRDARADGEQLIPDVIGADECQALPTVAHFAGRYHMTFSYRASEGFRKGGKESYKIGYAWSHDLKAWHRADEALRIVNEAGAWDSEMQCYPSLFTIDNCLFLLYNGNDFGRLGFGVARLEELE